MPALLPKAHAFNKHAVIYKRGDTRPKQPWARIMFLEGSFTMTQAMNFPLAHTGIKGRQAHDPAAYFTGPVEVHMVLISPDDPLLDPAKTAALMRMNTNNAYANPSDWAIARFAVTELFKNSTHMVYVIRDPWWVQFNLED